MHTFELTPRLEAEARDFAHLLDTVPAELIVSMFESPPPKSTMPQRWMPQPHGVD